MTKDYRRLGFIATIVGVGVFAPLAWQFYVERRIHRDCTFYAMGAVAEYRKGEAYTTDRSRLDASEVVASLPEAFQAAEASIGRVLPDVIVADKKSKAAYEACLQLNK